VRRDVVLLVLFDEAGRFLLHHRDETAPTYGGFSYSSMISKLVPLVSIVPAQTGRPPNFRVSAAASLSEEATENERQYEPSCSGL